MFLGSLSLRRSWLLGSLLAGAPFLVGCDPGPKEFVAPPMNADAASAACLAEYDADKNSALNKAELAKVPGIAAHLDLYDIDKNGEVSGNELVGRLRRLAGEGTAMTNVTFQITLDGKALEGADVKLVPEKYFGDGPKVATGKTDNQGFVSPSISDADLKPEEMGLRGVRVATYRLEVTHPMFQLPAKYNTATELGVEVAPDTHGRGTKTFALKSK